MTSPGLCVRLTSSPCLTHVTGRAGFTPMPCSQTPCPPGQPAHVPGLSVWEQVTARAPASAAPHQAPSRKAHSRAALDGEAMLTTHRVARGPECPVVQGQEPGRAGQALGEWQAPGSQLLNIPVPHPVWQACSSCLSPAHGAPPEAAGGVEGDLRRGAAWHLPSSLCRSLLRSPTLSSPHAHPSSPSHLPPPSPLALSRTPNLALPPEPQEGGRDPRRTRLTSHRAQGSSGVHTSAPPSHKCCRGGRGCRGPA